MEILNKGTSHMGRIKSCGNCGTKLKYEPNDVHEKVDNTFGVDIKLSKIKCPVCGEWIVVRGF